MSSICICPTNKNIQRERRLELLAQLTFSPQSIISEAAATIAGDVAFPDAARLAFERDELFPLAGLDNSLAERYLRIQHLVDELEGAEVPIARDYLDGKLEFVRAGAALEREVLMAHPEATLKYINEYRTYMLAYTLGRRLTKACVIERAGHKETNEDPWSSYRQLILSKVSLEDCASHHLPIDIARTKP